jgi:hypothetical protein
MDWKVHWKRTALLDSIRPLALSNSRSEIPELAGFVDLRQDHVAYAPGSVAFIPVVWQPMDRFWTRALPERN